MSLLLLVLALGAAVYTANTKLLDAKIAEAKYRKDQAYVAAEAGIDHALSHIDSTNGFFGTLDQSAGDKFSVTVAATEDPVGTEFVLADNPNIKFRTVTSTGYSSDHTNASDWHSEQIIEQKVYRRPVAGGPASAVTVSGTLTVGGNFKVGANPNGGGTGVPVSVWSNNDVKVTGSGSTCGLEEFDDPAAQGCDNGSYSDKDNIGSDIIANDAGFPSDLLLHTFGFPRADYLDLKDNAKYHVADCSGLDASSTGFYWVTGSCDFVATVGTPDTPVIVVVENGSIKLNGNNHVHGIVYSLYVDTTKPVPNIQMNGTAAIKGALIVDSDIELSAGGLKIRYSPEILAQIIGGENPEFSSLHVVLGSWKDF